MVQNFITNDGYWRYLGGSVWFYQTTFRYQSKYNRLRCYWKLGYSRRIDDFDTDSHENGKEG